MTEARNSIAAILERQRARGKTGYRRASDGPTPLSFAQRGVWFEAELDPSSLAYNVTGALSIEGRLDEGAFASALDAVARRHDVFRTSFFDVDGDPVQMVAAEAPMELARFDARTWPAADLHAATSAISRTRFDLRRPPLFRAALFRTGDERWLFVYAVHHIIWDALSHGILLRDLARAYDALVGGRAIGLDAVTVRYADYAATQQEKSRSQAWAEQLAWWRQRLEAAPPSPHVGAGALTRSEAKECVPFVFRVEPDAYERVRATAAKLGVTPFVLTLAAFDAFLSRLSAESDVLVVIPTSDRSRETRDVIGFFVNSLITRVHVTPDLPFADLVQRVDDVVSGAFDHADIPIGAILEGGHRPRVGALGLAQVSFSFHRDRAQVARAGEVTMSTVVDVNLPIESPADLALRLLEDSSGALIGTFEYRRDKYDDATIARLAARYALLLDDAARHPMQPLAQLPIVPADEKERVLVEWNATEQYGLVGTTIDMFAAQAQRTPDAIALELDGAQMTYRELDERSDALAATLVAHGAGSGKIVALMMRRSFELLIAVYGVLKSGAAYAPLDPDHPLPRLRFLIEDLGAELVLVEPMTDASGALPKNAVAITVDARAPHAKTPRLQRRLRAADAAYVIYTSGSTGRPKGVVNVHGGLLNRLLWMQHAYGLGPGDAVLHKTPYTFDVSVWELLWPLMFGARLVIASPDGHRDPSYLARLIRERGVSTSHFVPSMLAAFLEEPAASACTSLRRVICSGEALPRPLQSRFHDTLPGAELHNLYGPTEASIDVTSWACRADDDRASVPIGRPIWNTQIYVLDDSGGACPIGVLGELYIGGTGVARGYWRRADLTAERFVPNPFSSTPGARMYNTGDLARWLPDGTLEYCGRRDHQVKIRGMRIELGEIESVLASVPGVTAAAAVVRQNGHGDKRLDAYVCPASLDVSAVKAAAAKALPEAMIPTTIVALDSLPLTSSGKVDRKALPEARIDSHVAFVAPRTPVEEKIAAVWREVLGVERVGRDDDFFALGGHSLTATKVMARLRAAFRVDLPLRAIFDHSILFRLAEHVGSARSAACIAVTRIPRDGSPIPASPQQEALWFLSKLIPGSNVFGAVAVIDGGLDEERFAAALSRFALRHEVLRTSFAFEGERVVQRIHEPGALPLDRLDLRDATPEALAEVRRNWPPPIDLERSPWRAALVRTDHERYELWFAAHHAIWDAGSTAVLRAELPALYRAELDASAPPCADLPFQYADYTIAYRKRIEEVGETQLAYWSKQLAGAGPIELPPDEDVRSTPSSLGGWVHRFFVDRRTADALREHLALSKSTLFHGMLAAFAMFLARWCRQRDLVIAAFTSGRTFEGTDPLVGCFYNTLPVRIGVRTGATFRTLVDGAREKALDALANGDVPFASIVEEVSSGARRSRTAPFAEVGLTMLAGATTKSGDGDLALSFPLTAGTFEMSPAANLELYAGEAEDGRLVVELVGDAAVVSPRTLERMAQSFGALLGAAVERPTDDIALLPFAAARDVTSVEAWNATTQDVGLGDHVHDVFAAQAARTPEAVALEFGSARMTYRELDERSNALAATLVARGAGPGKIVALMMQRSLEMLVAIYGILKSGAAYAPLDPEHPIERLHFMIDDLGAELLLVEPDWSGALPERVRVVVVDALAPYRKVERPRGSEHDEDVAYVIYTSGSTGRPKGVMNVHSGLRNRLAWMQHAYRLGPGDVVLQKTPYTFDVSVWELVWPLMFGATLVIARPNGHKDPSYLARLVRERGVTTSHFVPSMLGAFLEERTATECPSLRRVICSGEALPRALQDRFHETLPACELHNLYGPTEASIDVTFWECRADDGRTGVPIGRPIWNTQIHIVDDSGGLCPLGVFGELCIAGAGLARGYWKRPDLTAERFVPDPYSSHAGARMYRTGDLARWLPDGTIEYGGRLDHQVKIRGLRIELGEIESVLAAVAGVQSSAVVVREDTAGDKRLVAYVCPQTVDVAAIKRELARHLPDYMVPGAFVTLEALPLTTSGKTDRKALPVPDLQSGAEYVAPRRPLEDFLATTFAAALRLPRVGIHDDFFALGGHSLLVMRVVAQIRERLGRDVQVGELFSMPTVAMLAEHLASDASRPTPPRLARSEDVAAGANTSFAQDFMLAWEKRRARSETWTQTILVRLRDASSADAVAEALRRMLTRQESLRQALDLSAPGWAPRLLQTTDIPIAYLDARAMSDEAFERWLEERANDVYAIAGDPLVRPTVIARAGEVSLHLSWHHLVHDPTQVDLLASELAEHHAAIVEERAPKLPPLPIRYVDYARWEREWFDGPHGSRDIERARDALRGYRGFELADRPTAPLVSTAKVAKMVVIEAADWARVEETCRAHSFTTFMAVTAFTGALLRKLSQEEDVAVIAPVNLRNLRPELANVAGRFLNVLPVRLSLDGDPSFLELFARTRTSILERYAYEWAPISRVFETDVPLDDPRGRVTVNYLGDQTASPSGEKAPAFSSRIVIGRSGARNDLFFVFWTVAGKLHALVGAAADRFEQSTVNRYADELRDLIVRFDRNTPSWHP